MVFGFSGDAVAVPAEEVDQPFFCDQRFSVCGNGTEDPALKPVVDGAALVSEN